MRNGLRNWRTSYERDKTRWSVVGAGLRGAVFYRSGGIDNSGNEVVNMTQAEKMAHEIGIDWYTGHESYLIPDDAIEKLIHQVAERTREECYRVTLKKMEVTKYTGWKPLDDCLLATRNARWEDEEA